MTQDMPATHIERIEAVAIADPQSLVVSDKEGDVQIALKLGDEVNAQGTSTNQANQTDQSKAQQGDLKVSEKLPIVVFETTQGNIEITLMPGVAPKACENFLGHVKQHYYDGIVFHRIIKDFMIQGGDPTGTGAGGESIWGKAFDDEFSKSVGFDRPGLLAMANRGPKTNGSQFFITVAETPWLNQRHTIFGEVTKGMDIVKKLETVKTNAQDKPVEAQKILKAYVKQ